ncbi:MAG: Lrp/AsnC family transcriptional regulator [Promethearchaeota archaeon]|jgi:DNA-binding Lrp family transcriptional regulator
MQLDGIDKQILRALFRNGRESLTNLEKTIFKSGTETMSHTGIAKRITKLEDSGILKVQANTNINKLQYKAVFILMEMSNYEEVQNIIKAYEECPRVFMLAHVTGQYNLILGVIGQNVDVLHRYLNYCGPTNKKGILHSASIFASDLILPKFLPLNLFSQESKESQCGNICKKCAALLDGKCNGCGKF